MVVASLVDSLSKIGAIGGIISFVGVGLMILLVAAQSRQIRAMREWIDAEPERQAETAQRVIAEVQRRIAAARERRAAQAVQPPAMPGAAGQARQVPPAPGTLGATPEARAVAAAKASETTAGGAATEILPESGSVPPPGGGGTPGEPPVFAPLTPAGADAPSENGAGPVADDAAPAIDAGQDTQLSDPVPDEYDPLAASTPAASGFGSERFADDPYDYDDHHDEEPRGNRALFGVGAAALIAGIVIAGFVLFGGGGGDEQRAGSGGSDTAGQTDGDDAGNTDDAGGTESSTPSEIDPASIRVTVLNGTKVNGLAAAITDKLSGADYTVGQPNSYSSDSTVATSIVEYRPGTGNETKAKQVAKELGISTSAVQPIDVNVSAAAPESADVVVLTGQDLAGATSGTSG